MSVQIKVNGACAKLKGKGKFYIDGVEVGEFQDVVVGRQFEFETKENIFHMLNGASGTASGTCKFESNIKVMSNEMRTYCKSMRFDGKLYL